MTNIAKLLKPEFLQMMREILCDDFDAFFDALGKAPLRGLRCRNEALLKTIRPNNETIAWCSSACYIDPDDKAGASPLHEAGAYYIQEPSAMLPAAVLRPTAGECVLDLCAAPGGKSTQMAIMMENKGTLVANEIHPERAKILSRNIERMGIKNCIVTNNAAAKLAEKWPNVFDKILVDAPCSGEGMFRKSPDAIREWNKESPLLCKERQLDILNSAKAMLKPGGLLLYSTCTFNRHENDEVIRDFLNENPNFILEEFSLFGKKQPMLHIYPHKVKGEGHFIALLRKTEDESKVPKKLNTRKANKQTRSELEAHLPAANQMLQEHLETPILANSVWRQSFVCLPEHPLDLDGLHVLRLGLHLASMNGKHIVLDHALSHYARLKKVIHLNLEDAQNYLTGASLPCDESLSGFVSLCFEGYALGFGKASYGMIKNHYPKGLRKNLMFCTLSEY